MDGPALSKRKVIPIFALAHFSHHLCTGSLVPLLPLIRISFGLEYFQSGVLVSAFGLAYGFGGPPVAWLADRVSRRLLIATGLVGVSLTAMAVGVCQSYYQLIVLLVLMGLLGASYHASASSLLSSILSSQERGRSLGLHIVGGASAFLLTPVLAGTIASLASWDWAFILLSFPALFVAAMVAIVVRKPEAMVMKAMMNQSKERTPLLEVGRTLGGIVVVAIALQVVSSAFSSYLPLFLADVHGIDPALAGMLGGVAIGTAVFGAPVGGALSDRFGRKPVIVASLVGTGPLIYLVAVLGYGPALFGAMALYGFLMSMRMAPMESLIADVVPMNRRATVLGIYYFLSQKTAGVATPLVGRVIDAIGPSSTFILLAALATLVALLILLFRRRL
jgi:MFS family permease